MEYRSSLRELAGAQKGARGVSLYSTYVNRPLGRVAAAAGAVIGMTPNAMSLLSGLVTGVGIVMIAVLPPSVIGGVAVWLALAVGFALDSADGQLARLRRMSHPRGEWLDHVLDAGKTVTLHAAVLIHWYRFVDLPDERLLLVPLVMQAAAVTAFVAGTLAAVLLTSHGVHRATGEASRLRGLVLLTVDYGVVILVFLTLGAPGVFVGAYLALTVIRVIMLAVMLARWFRQLGAVTV